MWVQRRIGLRPRARGVHLVTREVVEALPELGELEVGIAHLFIQHTSESLTLPVARGRLELGIWQGVYLCEHRDSGGPRSIVATLWGEGRSGGTGATLRD